MRRGRRSGEAGSRRGRSRGGRRVGGGPAKEGAPAMRSRPRGRQSPSSPSRATFEKYFVPNRYFCNIYLMESFFKSIES
jgi:hypothetical protein